MDRFSKRFPDFRGHQSEPILPGMISPRPKPYSWTRPILVLLCLAGIFAVVRHAPVAIPVRLVGGDFSLDSINNRTLGFEKIYRLGLPDKRHKRDAQLIAAQYVDIKLESIPGVVWQSIPKTELPEGWSWKSYEDWNGHAGAWRAHMDLMAEIVEKGVSSALIIEDDADYDVNVKEQLIGFAKGSRALLRTNNPTSSPYGDNWDLLWVGGCNFQAPDNDEYYIIENDPTSPPVKRRWATFKGPSEVQQDNTRFLFKPHHSFCATGYAVSLEGAKRMLTANSLLPMTAENDQEFGRACGGYPGKLQLKCLAVYPPIFNMHRFEGPVSRDSDIETWSEDERHPAHTYDTVYSTALNVERLAWGNSTAKAQWSDVTQQEIELNQKYNLAGSIRKVEYDERTWLKYFDD